MHDSAVASSPTDATDAERIGYSVKRAAEAMDLSERTVWELVRRGELESIKIGASRRIKRDWIDQYFERKREAAAA